MLRSCITDITQDIFLLLPRRVPGLLL